MMRSLSIIIISLSFITACNSLTESDSSWLESTATPILGGNAALTKKSPLKSVGLIFNKTNKEICTAVFIEPQIILTAAHCLTQPPEDYTIALGEKPFSGNYFARKIVKIIRGQTTDLALAKIDKDYPPGWSSLPILAREPQKGESVTLLGFGKTEDKTNGQILATQSFVADITEDKEILFSQENKKGICFGDSGSPLLIESTKGWLVGGIAKAVRYPDNTPIDEQCFYEGVFTSTLPFASWIFKISSDLKNSK